MNDAGYPGGDMASTPVSDADRKLKIDQVQQALAHDVIDFDEVDDRFEAIFRAETQGALAASVADLPVLAQPPPPEAQRHMAPSSNFVLIGDVKVGGWLDFGPGVSASAVIGDILIDASSASIPSTGLDITARLVIGDIKIIVPDGARVQSNIVSVIGSRKEILVAPTPGGPQIRISTFSLIGDTKVYSLSAVPEGKLRRAWASLRGSLGSAPPR